MNGFPNVTKSLVQAAQIRCLAKLSLPVVDAQKVRYSFLPSSYTASGAQVQPASSGATFTRRGADQVTRSVESQITMDLLPACVARRQSRFRLMERSVARRKNFL